MICVLRFARAPLAWCAMLMGALALAACEPVSRAGLQEGPAVDTGAAVPVALLVPGGSRDAGDPALAQSLENAARLAVADLGGAAIDLRVYQTAGQPGRAASAATRAVDEGARVILGPVFAQAANAAGVAVADRGVNVLSFSNNPDIAGGNVFILGPTFRNTADRLVRYSAGQGIDRIMIVHATSPAEEVGREAIANAIAANGAELVATGSFPLAQQGLREAAPGIADRAREAGAEAVFLTSTADGALPFLAQALPENGLGPATVQYLGLGRWDRPPQTSTLPGLQGGWFALPAPDRTAQFRRRYESRYGRRPLPVTSLAYDGVAAIGALLETGSSNALTRSALTRGSGFVGVNGVFRLRPDGTNQRGLAIAEIRDNRVTIIDPAPSSFAGPGF